MIEITSEKAMREFGHTVGGLVHGGNVIELVGDVGAGKTTFVKGLAKGLAIDDDIQSPSFTINRTYVARDGLELSHYDFYRLHDPGIMMAELQEATDRKDVIVVIEWAGIVKDVLPLDRLTIHITANGEESRHVLLTASGERSKELMRALK